MAFARRSVWDMKPHTAAKHEILRMYLGAWFQILGVGTSRELYYFDGFSGPGEYNLGEPGSPIIALDVAAGVSSMLPSTVHFVFSDVDVSSTRHLEGLLRARSYPPHFKVDVQHGRPFELVITEYLDKVEALREPPALFVFVDPFGWKGFPMEIVQRILTLPRAEVFINFMYEEINRFISVNDQDENFDALFGCHDWADIIDEVDPRVRNHRLWELYDSQLRSFAGVRYVRSFEMRNDRDVVDYYLFYGTGHLLGLEKMKEAMWKVDPSGRFRFSDATNPAQMTLFGGEPDFSGLDRLLKGRFLGSPSRYSVVEEYVVAETPFTVSHGKKVLRDMEMAQYPALQVASCEANRRRGTFADPDALLEFLEPPSQSVMVL